MVFLLEEAVAAAAAPDARGDNDELRTCTAVVDGSRYFMYATGAFVVVLVENQDAATPLNPRSEARRTSQFDLWQVWTSDDAVRCVRFNTSRKAACSAIALCVDEGRGVLLMPCGASARPASAATNGSAIANGDSGTFNLAASGTTSVSGRTEDVASDYAKVHMQLQLTTWRESVRWKSEDRLMDRIEWVESGAEDLLLVGAGERVTIWKIVDDAAQVYLQRSFSLRGAADSSVRHFDVTSGAGRFLATAARHDRVIKVWHLDAFDRDGAPICQFLAHPRALVQLQWAKAQHTFKLRSARSSRDCEMLFALDRAGNVSIWRESVTTQSFVLWKVFSGQDYVQHHQHHHHHTESDATGHDASATIRAFGLVSHAWARPTASTIVSIPDAMLDETNVLAALALFHYGVHSLHDVRRSELYSQRMDGVAKMNAKLMGDKAGALADTHAGETLICGNVSLAKTFAVFLLYGVHDNGDLCLFRTEFIPFSGVAPRVSLLLIFNGLRAHLADATIVNICSSDYRDRENGSSTFVIEIVFHPRSGETHVKVARLKLQADSASFGGGARGSRAAVCYVVQSCEIGDLCDCVFGAKQRDGTTQSLAISTVRIAAASRRSASLPSGDSATIKSGRPHKVAVANIDGRVDVFRPSASLRKLHVVCRPHPTSAMCAATHTCCYDEQSVVFFFANGKLHAAATATSVDDRGASSGTTTTGAMPQLFGSSSSMRSGSFPSASSTPTTDAVVCYEDETEHDASDDAVLLDSLTLLRVPETQKLDWATSHSMFGSRSALPTPNRPTKDYCVVVGLVRGGAEVLVWVFSFEAVASSLSSLQSDDAASDDRQAHDELDEQNDASRLQSTVAMQLHRKVRVAMPSHEQIVALSNVPSLEPFAVVFATIDVSFVFELWTFADLDDLTVLQSVQRTDIAALIRTASAAETRHDIMSFHVVAETFAFQHWAISACGRVAVHFARALDGAVTPTADASVCILPLLESCCEGIVVIEQKKLGTIVSLEWTPPVSPDHACQLLFLSTTAIGVLAFDPSLLTTSKWHHAWSSSRFSVKPQRISSLSSYPHALLALGETIASINVHDLSGATPTTPANTHSSLPFRIAQSSSAAAAAAVHSPSASAAFGAHHPVTLLFLLLRGSFRSLEFVLEHIKTSMLAHEKRCYLHMQDDAPLSDLPLLSLTQLLGVLKSTATTGGNTSSHNNVTIDDDDDERPAVYRSGKQSTSGLFGATRASATASAAAPARASDLFAMDYRSSRSNNMDRAEMLFAPRALSSSSMSSSTASNSTDAATSAATQSALEDAALASFFSDRRSSLAFLSPQDADAFVAVVSGMRKTVTWERDVSRAKDEAALRFHASLLWPLQQSSSTLDTKASSSSSSSEARTAALSAGAEASDNADDTSDDAASHVAGICSEQVVWGALTDCQDELLQTCFPASMMTWRELQQLRLPFWVQSIAKLQQFVEKTAQSEFASTRDPFHVAVFYVLLGKTKLLASLFKMSNETRIYELLSNDFSDARWRNAAIKNAYVLKAKRRYALSTAFFLLGGKVQEAIAVAEHADRTLVLSFLIARLSEKWDLGGSSSSSSNSDNDAQFSFSGLSNNMRSLSSASLSVAGGSLSDAMSCKGVCAEYLQTVVWSRAQACGDVYMSFLIKHLVGDTRSGIECLLAVPTVEMRCVFDTSAGASAVAVSPRALYWRAFGQSLLGACEIVRFLQSSLMPLKLPFKTRIVALQTCALNRVQRMGLHTVALVQQRDFASFSVAFMREQPRCNETAALLACRHRILAAVLGTQIDGLYAAFLCRIRDAMLGKSIQVVSAATATTATVATDSETVAQRSLEAGINDEIRCLVNRSGAFALESVLETTRAFTESTLRSSVVRSLVHSCRLAGLDFVVSSWNATTASNNDEHTSGDAADSAATNAPLPQCTSPLPHFIEFIVEGIALVASGDLVASSTDQLHTRRVDQTCAQLLSSASRLLVWLSYYYAKPAEERAIVASSEYVRVAAAAIYSVICVCARFIRSPCCLHRALGVIFPHKDALPKKALDELRAVAHADVCIHCTAARSAAFATSRASGSSISGGIATMSLQQAIPALYLVVEMLQTELDAFVSDVKTNRLNLAAAASSLLFTYCPYWTLALLMATSAMPAHVTKVAVDGASVLSDSTRAAKQLVQVWTAYSTRLSKFAARRLLCDFAGLYFRPFDVAASSNNDARGATGASAAGTNNNVSPPSGSSSLPPSPTRRDTTSRESNDPRRLLSCSCARCPWLLLVTFFTNKDELLLRVQAQLECCSDKIKHEISWGHLPDFPSKKPIVLTRSQKLLLTTAEAGKSKAPGTPRTADLADLFEKRVQSQTASSAALQTICIYRSEVSLKSMCFNRATETAELVLCSSRGICRTGCADYSDGSKFQFKGMYANPQASFFADANFGAAVLMRRKSTIDNGSNGSRMLAAGSPSPASIYAGAASASPSDAKAPSFKPTAVESHPFLPLFVSGNQKGNVHLWSYDSLSAVCAFEMDDIVATFPSSPSLTSRRDVMQIKFDNLGQQMGAVDTFGRLAMWKFSSLDREACYRQLDCHDKGAKALTFVNAGSCVATVGSSSDKRSVCLWDLLLPTSKALVAAPVCHPAGAASIAFSSTHQLIISGGEGGSISVFDVRQRRVLHTITNAHETAITTLELHPSGHCVLSGSASGDVKIWSLPIFREVTALSKVHAKPSFLGDAASNILGDAASNMAINVTSSSWGVTDAIATDDYFFTSGTDGSVQRMRVPSLSKLF